MSMILDFASTARGALDHFDTTQAVNFLARGGSRRSTHFFLFGGGAGMLLWIPIVGLAFLYQFVKRNPDKARMYKERLKENFASDSSTGGRPPAAPTAPGTASVALMPGAHGRPPRLRLPTGPGSPTVSPGPIRQETSDRPWMRHPPGTGRSPGVSALAPNPVIPRVQALPTESAQRVSAPALDTVKSATATWSFNPPPQWPLRPGFTPGPGWTPDPSWPPAPPGWRFWIQHR